MTGQATRQLCPRCRDGVLRLPTPEGLELFDPDAFALDDVNEQDRFVVIRHNGAVASPTDASAAATCLRRHRCQGPDNAARTARPDIWRAPTRADYNALRQLQTSIELYRVQELGRLRAHPGQRRYETVTAPSRLASLGRLDSDHCSTCRRQLEADDDTLVVGTVDDSTANVLRTCFPSCPSDSSAQDNEA